VYIAIKTSKKHNKKGKILRKTGKKQEKQGKILAI